MSSYAACILSYDEPAPMEHALGPDITACGQHPVGILRHDFDPTAPNSCPDCVAAIDRPEVPAPLTDLQGIRGRASAASEGQWQRHGADVRLEGQAEPLFVGRDGSAQVRQQADADAEFVANGPEDILTLLSMIDSFPPAPNPCRTPTD